MHTFSSGLNWPRLGWILLVVLCLAYGPMAAEYMAHYFYPDSPRLWDSLFSMLVSEGYAVGNGSVYLEQYQVYSDLRVTMLIHTSLGGLAILLFAGQFMPGGSRRFPSLHRWNGRLTVLVATGSMLSGFVFLTLAGPERIFNGVPFWLQLWGLAVGTLGMLWLGVFCILKRQVMLHQCAMAMAFALLLTAPLLRILWVMLGNLWPQMTILETNITGAALLGTLAPGGAIIASRCFDHRRDFVGRQQPLPGTALTLAIWGVGLVSLLWIVFRHQSLMVGNSFWNGGVLLAMGGGLLFFLLMQQLAKRAGKPVAADEWRLYGLAMVSSLPLFLLLWCVLGYFFSVEDAFFSTALVAPAIALVLGYWLMMWRRWVK